MTFAGVALAQVITCAGGLCENTNEADEITGTDLRDRIFAVGGRDTVFAGARRDKIDGGGAGDTLADSSPLAPGYVATQVQTIPSSG
jgi:hypothetical protein